MRLLQPAPGRLLPRVQILLAAALFSTGGAAIKATVLSAWQVAGFRAIVAGLMLVAVWRRAVFRKPSGGELWVALAYAVALPGFVLANKLTTAASTIFLFSTAPFWVLLLSPWLLAERWSRRDFALMGLLLAGGVVVLALPGPTQATALNPALGNWVAVSAGFVWALTILGLRRLSRGGDHKRPQEVASSDRAKRAVVWGNLFVVALVAPLLFQMPPGGVQPTDVLVIGYLGAAQVGLAYVFLLSGLRRVRAFEASLVLLLEPVLSPVWAWAIHGERPGGAVVTAGAVILATLAWLAAGRGASTANDR